MKYKCKYNLSIILLILFFIFLYCLFNATYNKQFKEPLSQKNIFVLIGDSILNNSKYVPLGNSIADLLKSKIGVNDVVLLAKDGATIETCFNQLMLNNNVITNDEKYNLYISIGGNNILNEFNNNENINKKTIKNIFQKYKNLIKKIKSEYSKTNIYILNLYFPPNKKYKKIIEEWNILINSFSIENNYNLLRLDNLLINNFDFVHEIEPSLNGSKKIAELIINS